MQPMLRLILMTALLALIGSNAPGRVVAGTSPVCAKVAEAWSNRPLPAVHVRIAAAALIVDFEYRAGGVKSAPLKRLAALRFNLNESGSAQIVFFHHNHRREFPPRSA